MKSLSVLVTLLLCGCAWTPDTLGECLGDEECEERVIAMEDMRASRKEKMLEKKNCKTPRVWLERGSFRNGECREMETMIW